MLTLKKRNGLQGIRPSVRFALIWVTVVLSLILIHIPQYHCMAQAAVQWPECNETFHINPPVLYTKYLAFGLDSLWVSDPDQGVIWRLSPVTGAVQGSIPSNYSGGIAFDGQYLWKAAYSSPVIRCIRPTDGTTVREIPGVGTQQAGLAWDGTYLWIADRSTQRIYKLNPSTGAQLNSFDSPGPYPRGLAWWNGYLYHSDSHEDTIYQIDPIAGTVVSKITAPTRSSSLRGLAYDGNRLWYSEWDLGIDRLVVDVSPDGRAIYSNPSLMMVEERYQITNTGATPGENLEAYWSVPMEDDAHEIIELIYDPPPDEYVYDKFDQKIAHFTSFLTLMPGDTEEIVCRACLKIWRKNYQIDPDQVGTLSDIPEGIKDLYLVDADFLQITHPDIVAAAESAIGDETNPYLMAIGIHDYVRDSLVYDSESGTAYDALSILHAGRGVCEHYATLFVSLGRSVGLPTRIVKHFHYYEESGACGGHVWADAYIPGYGWIPFDPTRDDSSPPRKRFVACEPLGIINFRNGGTDDRYVSRWGRCWVTHGMGNTRELLHQGLSPLRLSNFSASNGAQPCSVEISWTNPIAPDLSTVLVKRKQGAYPASRNDGVTVYEDTSPIAEAPVVVTDTGLAPGETYYYAVFTQSATGIWRSVMEEGANADTAVASSSETAAMFRVDLSGNVYADGAFYGANFNAGSADIAEWVPVSEPVEPGDVLELDPDNPGHYRKSRGPCSTLVAGVVSTDPGFVLGTELATDDSRPATEASGLSTSDRSLLALVGIVPVKVTNEAGPIKPGDLLVTSFIPGYAMRWDPGSSESCSFIGKALEASTGDCDVISVLLIAH